jgi:hypothetical protein
MMVSCADESGTDFNGPTRYASIAGFVGPTVAWIGFQKTWLEVLREFELDGFHTTTWLRRRDSLYEEWPEGRRLSLGSRLADAINRYNLRGFAVQLSVDEYELSGHATPVYLVLFDAVLSLLNAIMADEIFFAENLVTYFGKTSNMESRARRLYQYRLESDDSMRDRFWVDRPQFVSPDEQVGLQPADLLANVARNYVRGRVNPELNTFLAKRSLLNIVGYNQTKLCVMNAEEIAQSAERVQKSKFGKSPIGKSRAVHSCS